MDNPTILVFSRERIIDHRSNTGNFRLGAFSHSTQSSSTNKKKTTNFVSLTTEDYKFTHIYWYASYTPAGFWCEESQLHQVLSPRIYQQSRFATGCALEIFVNEAIRT